MTTLLIQIAPQRSTLYSSLVSQLAPYEVKLSPVGKKTASIETINIAHQSYIRCQLDLKPDEKDIKELGQFAMTGSCFFFYENLKDLPGPFLKPIDTDFTPALPPDLVTTRRYSGKTNELFTHFLCNLARFSSDFSNMPWSDLRIYDPLAGGGTTLFTGLVLGADVAGVEHNKKSAHSTAVFLKQYMQEKNLPFTMKEENLKKQKASRWWFTLGKEAQQKCILAKGEIPQSQKLISGFKQPHFIVGDLPYGTQHKGVLDDLLVNGLPVWESMIRPGGSLVFSWDATRFSRSKMIDMVQSESNFKVIDEEPYNLLSHRVDRVIKNRDIIVART